MNIKHFILTLTLSSVISGCSSMSDYLSNIVSEDREELVVYKRDKAYDETQFDLEVPPDLITPRTRDVLEIPDYASKRNIPIFTVDTNLDNLKLLRDGRDSYLFVKTSEKKLLWDRVSNFWQAEGFRLSQKDFSIGIMKTVFLENLSEAQLGTVQRIVGRYVPLLVSPDTRDSFKTRFLFRDDGVDIILTHYGKEYMSDGDVEFRWQNRPRDPEIESEMLSRLYIYLGGEEAKSKGYAVVKSSGSRNKASLNIDENGIHTLYISDIFERVWPQTIRSLETIGVTINSAKENDGVISISASEVDDENTDSFFSNLIFWKSDNSDIKFNLVMSVDKDGTLIEVQDNNYLSTPILPQKRLCEHYTQILDKTYKSFSLSI